MHAPIASLRLAMALAVTLGAAVSAVAADAGSCPAGVDVAAANTAFAQAMFADQRQAQDLLWPLRRKNVARCQHTRNELGFRFFELPAAGGDGDAMVARNLGLEPGASVDHVIPGTPLALAGLQAGDRVVRIDGSPVATGRHAGAGSNALLDAAAAHAAAQPGGEVHLDIEREGQPQTVVAAPVAVCALDVAAISMAGPLAAGQPGRIDLDLRSLHEAGNDTDRTIVLAHAMAHQLDGDASRRAGVLGTARAMGAIAAWTGHGGGGLLGVAAGLVAHAGAEERADALSLDLLDAVGITPAQALAFWERQYAMPGQNPLASVLASHPLTRGRMTALRKAVADRQAGSPTTPAAPQPAVAITATNPP